MSVRLTCSICGKPDSRVAIVFEDPEEINDWQPYVCIDCSEKKSDSK